MTSEELYRQLAVKHNHRRARRGLVDPPYISEMNNLSGEAIEIVVVGRTRIETENYLDLIVGEILEEHNKMYKELVIATQELQTILARYLADTLIRNAEDDNSDVEKGKFSQRQTIQEAKLNYELGKSLLPPLTVPTSLVGNLEIHKVSHISIAVYLIGGAISGLAICFIFISKIVDMRNLIISPRTSLISFFLTTDTMVFVVFFL